MTTSSVHTARRLEPLSIVVVDDDADQANGMRRLLGSLGYSCRVAYDGERALALVTQAPTDVVVTDSRMPGVDGLSLCRAIRARSSEPYVYVIVVSAHDEKTHLIEAMRSGADDFLTKPVDADELSARLVCAERVVRLHRSLRARTQKLRRDSERNFQVARVDALTGARNRRALAEDLHAQRIEAQRYHGKCAVAMCDLDRFKQYNDTFGHLAGDEALRRVVRTIDRVLRTGDGVYRYGGEEFVALLPHQDLERARAAMERVRRAVAETTGISHAITISIGIAEVRADDPDDEAPLRRADEALYRAKVAGRDRVSL